VFRRARHWSLSWARWTQSISPHPISLRSILIFSFHFGHYDTSWKVAGSNPDEVIRFFNWPNRSSRTMFLGSTQPQTEGWQSHRHLWADYLENMGASTSHNPMTLHGLLQG
jgi:hypothetical protein